MEQEGHELRRAGVPPRNGALGQTFLQVEVRQRFPIELLLHTLTGADVSEALFSHDKFTGRPRPQQTGPARFAPRRRWRCGAARTTRDQSQRIRP